MDENLDTKIHEYFTGRMENYKELEPAARFKINIQSAETVLKEAFEYCCKKLGSDFVWLPEYNNVATWLQDNEGKGLFLHGDCGRGKSLLVRWVIPSIIAVGYNRIFTIKTAQEMNNSIDKILEGRLISIDDVGTEDVLVDYGNKRLVFAELMDAVERKGLLAIISTNLSGDEIEKRYGTRTVERIISTTKRIEFKGESLRK